MLPTRQGPHVGHPPDPRGPVKFWSGPQSAAVHNSYFLLWRTLTALGMVYAQGQPSMQRCVNKQAAPQETSLSLSIVPHWQHKVHD